MITCKIKKLHKDAIIPHYEHEGDSGFDIYTIEDCDIRFGEITFIHTGISVEIPEGYELQIRPKSGLAVKEGITIVNSPGTVDSGYRGEIMIIATRAITGFYLAKKGTKIAQGVIMKVERANIKEVEELEDSDRGENGFGSTGI